MQVVSIFLIAPILNAGLVHDSEIQRQRIERYASIVDEHRESLTDSQERLARLYISAMEAQLSGNDTRQIALLDEVYDLAFQEYEMKKSSTLWRLFGVDFSGIPLNIANIVRDNNSISTENKLALLETQESRSEDSRISDMILELVRKTESIDAAIERARENSSQHPERIHYLVKLIELRLQYQLDLIAQAHKDRELPTDNPGSWDYDIIEHDQTCIALEEARVAVGRAPKSFQHSFFPIFRNALQDKLADCDQVSSFFEFGLERMKESPDIDEAAVTDTIDKIDAAMEKYCPEARLAQER